MVTAIVLAGGTGTRLGSDTPKQYLEVGQRPVISYCLERFQLHSMVDAIVIVAAKEWHDYISQWIKKGKVSKFLGFAQAGSSRQHSVLNGLNKVLEIGVSELDAVLIHDAARPNVSEKMITECIQRLSGADGAMPVLPVKDTIYLSRTGKSIDSLLERDQLFAGQSPECFNLCKYYAIHTGMSEEELAVVRGSSEIAYNHSLSVALIPGDERNYKITTIADLEKFKLEIEGV